MKKFLSALCLLLAVCLLAACGGTTPTVDEPAGEQPTATPEEVLPTAAPVKDDITEATDYTTELWRAVDIPFTATDKIKKIDEAEIDVTFTNRETGTKLVLPGFWDGNADWKVRFAPTEYGIWDYTVAATGAELGLNGLKGTVAANSYKGDLAIYQHGFIKTEPDIHYFMYNDGLPFFYLGDTHWTMLTEEFETMGNNSEGLPGESHFKYIVDKRAEQKFTVYQSEPIGSSYDVSDGMISGSDVRGFQKCDKYFAYIADKGLVHANAELIFPSACGGNFAENVRQLTRYWVARYAAYPVLSTLGQEVDDGTNYKVDGLTDTYNAMCTAIGELDPYHHPITAHQLNASTVTTQGHVSTSGNDYGGYSEAKKARTGSTRRSAFYDNPAHTWWGVQWRPNLAEQYNFDIARQYWKLGGGKVAVNYESRYDHLGTKEYGARAAGWISYLCGMFGYGYGAEDMWYYQSSYDVDIESTDGIETVTTEDKHITWGEMIQKPINGQMTVMYDFFNSFAWWHLVPDFDDGNAFVKNENASGFFVAAHDGDYTYVVYLYSRSADAVGALTGMDGSATYTAKWFDPRTGEYTAIASDIKPAETDGTFRYAIPEKPQAEDMVLLVTKNA